MLQSSNTTFTLTDINGYQVNIPAPTSSQSPVFPSSIFSSVSAATKVQDSLVIRQEDSVPEPAKDAPRIAQVWLLTIDVIKFFFNSSYSIIIQEALSPFLLLSCKPCKGMYHLYRM